MSRDSRPSPIKVAPYTAGARRSRTEQGVREWYWTVRCRRKGLEGEWTLGWFVSRRRAETAFTTWAASRTGRRSARGSSTMAELFEHYELAVARMTTKRKNTRWNRRYTAKQVKDFLDARYPDLLADHFDATVFEDYLGWCNRASPTCICPPEAFGVSAHPRMFSVGQEHLGIEQCANAT